VRIFNLGKFLHHLCLHCPTTGPDFDDFVAAEPLASEEGYFLGRSGDVVITGPKKVRVFNIGSLFGPTVLL
jgi:hypothetical protein